MKNRFSTYWVSFSKQQRRGIYLLCALIVLLLLAPLFFPLLREEPAPQEDKEFEEAIAALSEREAPAEESIRSDADLFPFDPNELSKEGWIRFGLSEKVSTNLIRYRAAGGVFYKKEDLKKIYGLREDDFLRLAPFMVIEAEKEKPSSISKERDFSPDPSHKVSPTAPSFAKEEKEPATHPSFKEVVVDINKADEAEWEKLFGIGPFRSKEIIKYRDQLGGFYNIHQVSEVWAVPDSIFAVIKDQLVIKDTSLKKIPVNRADLDDLAKHPYISYSLARSILSYREAHGRFDSLSELRNLQLVSEQFYRKLVFYINIK